MNRLKAAARPPRKKACHPFFRRDDRLATGRGTTLLVRSRCLSPLQGSLEASARTAFSARQTRFNHRKPVRSIRTSSDQWIPDRFPLKMRLCPNGTRSRGLTVTAYSGAAPIAGCRPLLPPFRSQASSDRGFGCVAPSRSSLSRQPTRTFRSAASSHVPPLCPTAPVHSVSDMK